MILGLIVIWAILGAIVGGIASGKGREFWAWFIYGFFLFPIALIHILVARPELSVEQVAHAAALKIATEKAAEAGRVACPHCAEKILPEAKVCRYCGRDVVPGEAAPAAPVEFVPDNI